MSLTYAKGVAGANTTHRTAVAEHKLGAVERAADNKVMVYGKATAVIAKDASCEIDLDNGDIVSGGGYKADAAFAVGDYGWVWKPDLT